MVFTVPKTLTEAHLRRVLDKEESDGRFPNAEVKNAQDQGRRYFAGLHQGSEAELVAWEARQAYIGMGFLLFAAAGMGIDSTALEGVDFPKLNEILGLDEKNLTAIAAVSLGYRSPKDGNAQRPKSRLTRDELFTSLDSVQTQRVGVECLYAQGTANSRRPVSTPVFCCLRSHLIRERMP